MKEIFEITFLLLMLAITILFYVAANRLANHIAHAEKELCEKRIRNINCIPESDSYKRMAEKLILKKVPVEDRARQRFNSNGPSSRKL